MRKILFVSFLFMVFIACQKAPQSEEEWKSLFDGETLDGWTVRGGKGDFYVEDGMIIGNSTMNVDNSFLCTEQEFSDFILQYDVKIDSGINSGMQIRSHVWQHDTTTAYLSGSGERGERTWKAGRLWGYQIEIDPSDRAWSGGFYEEGHRGWLVTLADKDSARQAFKPNEWNSFKVKAKGNHFQTWVNGVKAVDTTDDMSDSGFLGLQLHSINDEELVGHKVYWKNIKIKEL